VSFIVKLNPTQQGFFSVLGCQKALRNIWLGKSPVWQTRKNHDRNAASQIDGIDVDISYMEQNRTEQNRTEQNRTEQNRTEQNRQNRTEQNRTEPTNC